MKEVGAVELRRSVRRLARQLAREREPIALTLRGERVGVIVPLADFEERFALHDAKQKRQALVEEILSERAPSRVRIEKALDDLRLS